MQVTFGIKKTLVLMALAFASAIGGGDWTRSDALADTPQQAQPPIAKQNVDTPTRVDQYGDPLPPGALARLGTLRFAYAGWIYGLAFSPDGTRLASSGGDGIHIWESASGKPVGAYSGTAYGIRFLDGGKRIAAAGDDLTVWDVDARKEVTRVPLKGAWPRGSAFSPDGKLWAGVLKDGSLNLVDALNGSVIKRLEGHEDQISKRPNGAPVNPVGISSIAFAPDGKTLASSAYADRRIIIWDVATGKIRHALAGHERPSTIAYSADGRMLAVGGDDGVIRLWDTATGGKSQELRGLTGQVLALAFAPDGLTLASASSGFAGNVKGAFINVDAAGAPNATVHIWNLKTGAKRPMPGPDRGASILAFSPDGATIAAAGLGTWVHMIDVATGKERFTHAGHNGGILRVALSPDGKTLASGGRDPRIYIWDLETSRIITRLEGHGSHVAGLAFLPGGREIVSCSYDNTVVQAWDWRLAKEKWRINQPGVIQYGFALAPDGKTLLLKNGEVRSALTGKHVDVLAIIDGLNYPASVFSADGKKLVAPCRGFAVVVDAATGKEICRFTGHQPPVPDRLGYGPQVYCVAFAPDGRRAASGGVEGLAFIWDATTGKMSRSLQGHENPIWAIAFSPDGRMVATGSGHFQNHREQTVRLWEVATGKERRRFAGHQAQVTSIVFSRDGRTIISGSEDGTALVWDTVGVAQAQAKMAGDEEAWWKTLAGADAVTAYDAVCALAGRGDVAFLAERLRRVPAPDAAKISRLIADLASPVFAVRQKAEHELGTFEELAEPALRKAISGTESLEARRRIATLLGKLDTTPPGAKTLQALRGVEVLERIGSPEAKAVLAILAHGAPGARATEEAKASLQRLNARRNTAPLGAKANSQGRKRNHDETSSPVRGGSKRVVISKAPLLSPLPGLGFFDFAFQGLTSLAIVRRPYRDSMPRPSSFCK